MSKYTLSPLGLINTTGFAYNKVTGGYESIFSSYSGDKKQIIKDSGSGKAPILGDSPHQDQIYDVSTSNIIQQLSEIEHLRLDFADFAYLKDFGVYPNNRLVVCRRFPQPVKDDIYSESKLSRPISTVLGYVKDEKFPMNITVSEKWGDSDASFTTVLNELGEDFGMKGKFALGSMLEGGLNIVPLPGFSLIMQRRLMERIGIIEPGAAAIPQGNPNLIKESQRRTLVKENDSGSGLMGKFTIDLTTTYEQKFINGVDPSIVFMDVINNALSMGTSPEVFYLGKKEGSGSLAEQFMEDMTTDPTKKIKEILKGLIKVIEDVTTEAGIFISYTVKKAAAAADNAGILDAAGELITNAVEKVAKVASEFIYQKYKIKFLGIVTALTGAASTPWHVTIGNPLRPIFCSGDMLCTGVSIDFGPQLSFNDLPTYITVSVKLTSARNLGLNEIFAKFNSGGLRVTKGKYQGQYVSGNFDDFWSTDTANPTEAQETTESPTTSQESQSTDESQTTNTPEVEQRTQVSENGNDPNGLQINPDTNGLTTIVTRGDNALVDSFKDQTQQEVTGSSEGQPEQNIPTDNVPNEGVNAQTPQENVESSKPKYTYSIKKFGPKKYVEATDENGNIVYTGPSSAISADDVLIEEAKSSLNDF
jgi:hypothetical protein